MATYRDSGVDLEAADAVVASIRADVTATWGDKVRGGFGGFAAGIEIPAGYEHPILMMSTDGVGTKAEIARKTGMLDGLGYDLVAMCIDDLAAAGATPIAMTDYLAVGRMNVAKVSRLVRSIASACVASDVALLGGESAEHPGVMAEDGFDLAGTALGVVEAGSEVTGAGIEPGDIVIGLESPNLRSNGFSLIRASVLDRVDLDDSIDPAERGSTSGQTWAEALLDPSVLYAPAVSALLTHAPVKGLAHITGGGLPGNVPRILPTTVDAHIDTASWAPAPIFGAVALVSGATKDELYRTFNMGIGFVVIAAADIADDVVRLLSDADRKASRIGTVVPGTGLLRLL